jgi:hypothetical protein
MFETLSPVLNPEPWESSNTALRFKAANNIHYFVAKVLCPSKPLPHVGGFKNLLYVFWDMKTCIPAEDSFDRSESGGSTLYRTLYRNVRSYIASYSIRRKISLPPLWKSSIKHRFKYFTTTYPNSLHFHDLLSLVRHRITIFSDILMCFSGPWGGTSVGNCTSLRKVF